VDYSSPEQTSILGTDLPGFSGVSGKSDKTDGFNHFCSLLQKTVKSPHPGSQPCDKVMHIAEQRAGPPVIDFLLFSHLSAQNPGCYFLLFSHLSVKTRDEIKACFKPISVKTVIKLLKLSLSLIKTVKTVLFLFSGPRSVGRSTPRGDDTSVTPRGDDTHVLHIQQEGPLTGMYSRRDL